MKRNPEMSQFTLTINKREMTFTVNVVKGQKIYSLPSLNGIDKLQRKTYWRVYIVDNLIHRESWIEGGKVKKFGAVEAKGKNVGKKNETTDQEQAFFQAYSLYLKKQDQKYSLGEICPNAVQDKPEIHLPMLAQKYEDRGKNYLKMPCGASPKLDGIRSLFQLHGEEKNPVLTSRLGKRFVFLDKVKEQARNMLNLDNSPFNTRIILDGELYSHDLPFNAISGAARASKNRSKYDDRIEYWIFDICDTKESYSDRMKTLCRLETIYKKQVPMYERRLKFVYYEWVHDHASIPKIHTKFTSQGFEGLILRNLDGKYRFKHRVNDLMKYKDFVDTEYEIVGGKEGKGTEEGAIVFACMHSTGKTFDVRPRGSMEKRREMMEMKNQYIGKMLTVRYQKTDNKEETLPRFPVGIEIRDYE
jgi:DNA ligase-1